MLHAKTLLKAAFAFVVTATVNVANAQTSVPQAMRLQVGTSDLTNISRALGKELAHQEISGRIEALEGDLSFSPFVARDIAFKAVVKGLETSSRDGFLLSNIHLSKFDVRIGAIEFDAAPRARCIGLGVTFTGTQPLQTRLQIIREQQKLRFQAKRATFVVPGNQFRSHGPASCNTPWQTATLVQELGPWAADQLKRHIAEHVAAELNRGIGALLSDAGDDLVTKILLPWQTSGNQGVVASTDISPKQVLIRRPRPNHASILVDLSSVISVRAATPSDPGQHSPHKDHTPTLPRLTESWFGVSSSYLAGVLTEAYRQNLLTVTINKHTAPQLSDVLRARQLARFVPDAALRFEGHEDVELRIGKAQSIAVVIKPSGPGGIPIIDAYLKKVPLEIYVDQKAYVRAQTDLHFFYSAWVDEDAGVLVFDLEDTKANTGTIGFNPVLYPAPSDQNVRTEALNVWVKNFANHNSLNGHGIESITVSLPNVAIGPHRLDWHHTLEVIGEYLTTGFTIR